MYEPEELTEDRKKTYDLIWKLMIYGIPTVTVLLLICTVCNT